MSTSDVSEWLEPRQVGSNMDPWTFLVVDDRDGTPRDWTEDADGNADQHTGTFSVRDMSDSSLIVNAKAVETLTSNGLVVCKLTLAQATAMVAGRYRLQYRILNAAGTLVYEGPVYGQRILANV